MKRNRIESFFKPLKSKKSESESCQEENFQNKEGNVDSKTGKIKVSDNLNVKNIPKDDFIIASSNDIGEIADKLIGFIIHQFIKNI